MAEHAIQTKKEETAQSIRNVVYALSGIAALFGLVLDEMTLEPIILGIIGVINLITIIAAWWYSRRKFVVASAIEGAEG